MQSDATALDALHVVSGAIAAWQAHLTTGADRIALYLDATDDAGVGAVEAGQLGDFAAGRIDTERFSALWEQQKPLDQSERSVLTRARDILRELAARPGNSFIVNLSSGARLSTALGSTFADLGRGFGAIRVAELVRTGRFTADAADLIHGFPRFRWTRAERDLSPPVIVTLDGADCWAAEVAQFLDGNQKIVLIVRPPAPPAVLVRLITPGAFVLQSCSVAELAPALDGEGPAVAALMPSGAAEFIHRPGTTPAHERITISTKPQGSRKSVEGWSTWQQQQELDQLYVLTAAPVVAPEKQPQPVSDPADRLASWLLSHADLSTAAAAGAARGPSS